MLFYITYLFRHILFRQILFHTQNKQRETRTQIIFKCNGNIYDIIQLISKTYFSPLSNTYLTFIHKCQYTFKLEFT